MAQADKSPDILNCLRSHLIGKLEPVSLRCFGGIYSSSSTTGCLAAARIFSAMTWGTMS
jgi:hypothetical protein